MTQFQHYARFYDLLYAEKPYREEAAYVHSILEHYDPGIRYLLEAGCGTGIHAIEFAGLGYQVTGLDQSSAMISIAKQKMSSMKDRLQLNPKFVEGSLQMFRAKRPFDAVTALFHVMSYQTTAESLTAAIAAVAKNLRKGGLFFFDFWHEPGVLADPPMVRSKTVNDEVIYARRTSYPEHDLDQRRIKVRFELEIEEKESGIRQTVEEVHDMRYFNIDELRVALETGGFTLLNANDWMMGTPPSKDGWYACITARKD